MNYILDKPFVENYARQYAKLLCDRLFAIDDAIRGEQLVSISPVSQVNQLLIGHIFSSWQLEAQRIQSPIFNYQATEVQTAFREFMNLLARHIRMERDYFEPVLMRAVYDTFLFLLVPEEFLKKFVGENKSWDKEIKPALRYLKFHSDFIEKWKSQVKTAQLQRPAISAKEVFEIARILLQREPHLLMTQPQPIIEEFAVTLPVALNVLLKNGTTAQTSTEDDFDIERFERELGFVQPTSPTRNSVSPVSPEAKEVITQIQAEVRRELLQENVNQENRIDLIVAPSKTEPAHLGSTNLGRPRTEEEIYQEYLQNLKKQSGTEKAEHQNATEPLTASNTTPTPTTQVPTLQTPRVSTIQPGQETTSAPPTSPVDAVTETKPIAEQKPANIAQMLTINQQPKSSLAGKFSGGADKQQKTLKGLLSLHDKVKFQNVLFGADFNAVNEAIEAIDRCHDYHTAVALVKEKYAARYHWDTNNPVAMEFFRMLNKRF